MKTTLLIRQHGAVSKLSHVLRCPDGAETVATMRFGKSGLLVLASIAGMSAGAATAHAQTQTNAMGDTFTTQWSEDFTKETSLNTSRWNRWFNGATPTFDSTYGMKLTSTIGTAGSTSPYSSNPGNTDPSKAYNGTTLFGRYTARIYNSPAQGQRQSFWLVKPVFSNDDWNEIDLETYNADWIQTGTVLPTYTLHYGDWTPHNSYPPSNQQRGTQVPAGWHDWTIDWTPNYVAWYRDGGLMRCVSNNSTKPGWTEISGNGVESQTFPQSFMLSNSGTGGLMGISSVSYSALQMKSFKAAAYSGNSGGIVGIDSKDIMPTAPGTGQQYVGSLKSGDYLKYSGVETHWRNISIQVDCAVAGRDIQVHTGSPSGPIIGTIDVPVTRGPEWNYSDLVIQSDPTKIGSASHPFGSANGGASQWIGKEIDITGGNGFTAGTYTITAVDDASGIATLSAAAGLANSTGGQGLLQYNNPIRYTLASANLDPRSGPAQDLYLTQTGGEGGVNLYNIYFFGMQPTSIPEPATLALLGMGGILLLRHRTKA